MAGPATWVASGGTWPAGPFLAAAPSAVQRIAHAAAVIAAERHRLTAAGPVDAADVDDLVNGRTWPSIDVLAELEQALGVTLWPLREEPCQSPRP